MQAVHPPILLRTRSTREPDLIIAFDPRKVGYSHRRTTVERTGDKASSLAAAKRSVGTREEGMTSLSGQRNFFLACAAAALMFVGSTAFAQKDPTPPPEVKNPAPAKGPLMGRPETPGAQALAPVAPPPLTTPADKLPVAKIKVPKGFKVEVYVSGIKNARTLRLGDKGTLFVGNWQANKVWAVTNKGGNRVAKVIYEETRLAERPRLPQRHTLHRRAQENLQGRKDRRQPRPSTEVDHHL